MPNSQIEQSRIELTKKINTKTKTKWNFQRNWALYAMLIVPIIVTFIFKYLPMAGLMMAFQDYKPWLGFVNSPWVGLDHFKFMLSNPDTLQVIWNTLIISAGKLIGGLIAPFLFALFLNELRLKIFKRTVQTAVYLPHFLSWVILGGIFTELLSVEGGLVNQILGIFGIGPIFFLGEGNWFRVTVIITEVWKEFGYGAIVFLAALAGIDPALYEAAEMDGANRFQQTLHITIPEIIPVAMIVGVLSLNNLMDAGFDQIFNLYNPLVYEKGDIIDTYVYRIGILEGQFSLATAIGMLKSIIALIFILTGYRLAKKYADYRIF